MITVNTRIEGRLSPISAAKTPPIFPTRYPKSTEILAIMMPGRERPTETISSSSSSVTQRRLSTNSFCICVTMLHPPPKVNSPILKNWVNRIMVRFSRSLCKNKNLLRDRLTIKLGQTGILQPDSSLKK